MNKIGQIKAIPAKPMKLMSRLSELAATKVVSAGEAFASDLQVQKPAELPPVEKKPLIKAEISEPRPALGPKNAVKRTFRYPKDLDSELKKFVRRYNLQKSDQDPDLTMEEIGILMARHFLKSDPHKLINQELRPKFYR